MSAKFQLTNFERFIQTKIYNYMLKDEEEKSKLCNCLKTFYENYKNYFSKKNLVFYLKFFTNNCSFLRKASIYS